MSEEAGFQNLLVTANHTWRLVTPGMSPDVIFKTEYCRERAMWDILLAITERDLSSVCRVQGCEEAGHTEVGHAQSRLQDDRKLRLRDGAVLLRLKHLDDAAKDATL